MYLHGVRDQGIIISTGFLAGTGRYVITGKHHILFIFKGIVENA
jgi:hypothetical protein